MQVLGDGDLRNIDLDAYIADSEPSAPGGHADQLLHAAADGHGSTLTICQIMQIIRIALYKDELEHVEGKHCKFAACVTWASAARAEWWPAR